MLSERHLEGHSMLRPSKVSREVSHGVQPFEFLAAFHLRRIAQFNAVILPLFSNKLHLKCQVFEPHVPVYGVIFGHLVDGGTHRKRRIRDDRHSILYF